jgi:hypothetical protein
LGDSVRLGPISLGTRCAGGPTPGPPPIVVDVPVSLTAIVRPEPEAGGYSASIPALPGCHTQGETLGRVHDGSDPEKRLAPGYMVFEAYVRVARWQLFPLLLEPLKTSSGARLLPRGLQASRGAGQGGGKGERRPGRVDRGGHVQDGEADQQDSQGE